MGMQEYGGPVGRHPVLLRYARNAGVWGTGGLAMQEYGGPAHYSSTLDE